MIIGIVGCGGIAKAHVRALCQIPVISGLAFYDIDSDNMRALSTIATVPVTLCDAVRELTLVSQGVVICTPNHLHLSMAEQVLKHNKIPFVCEKPLATDLFSARRLAAMATSNSIVCFNYRYNRVIETLRQLQREHAFGEVQFFSAEFNKNSALIRPHVTWRDSAQQGNSSGALGDLACHVLDLFCLLSEDHIQPEELSVVKGTRIDAKRDGPVEVDDNGYVFGRSQRGAFFRIHASKTEEGNALGFHFNVVFERGEIQYSTHHENRLRLTRFDRVGVEDIFFSNARLLADPPHELPFWSDSFVHLHQDWCRTLQTGITSPLLPLLTHGLHIQEVIDAF